ncbi:hypothetical protein SK069_15915 [Patulibacter brassicae]|uniref:Uncharacterized protein n=1 Tax=Patulibacter brassicae TaxID=1705717 RepID=A0ABU4VMM0_9ACTN|nr:hypothetical protein [Patulibacter brassicae]MDX8153086.1 hypothetical protein [Patulibacter brassicae]
MEGTPIGLLATAISATVVVVAMGVAMAIVLLGHLVRSRATVATGIVLLFAATFGMLVGGFGAWRDSPGPAPDPLRGTEVPQNETQRESRERREAERDARDQQP